MRGIILAGGTGSRLGPLSKVTNKHLLPVGPAPMIYYPISQMLLNDIEDICIVSGLSHLGSVVELLGSGSRFGCRFTYKLQDEPGGICEALALCRDFSRTDYIAVILGDNIFGDVIDLNYKGEARLFLKQVEHPERFGIADVDHMKRLVDIKEKPSDPKSNLAVIGAYCYGPVIWQHIESLTRSERGELEITDLNKKLIDNYYVDLKELDFYWHDAGEIKSYKEVNYEIWDNMSKEVKDKIDWMIKR